MTKVFNVTVDGDYVIVAGQKGIIYAGELKSAPVDICDFVKFINCD